MPRAAPEHRFAFTEARLRALPDAPGRKVRYHDTACPGLTLRISGERRVFCYYAKVHGRPLELRLGVWPALTVEEARRIVRTKVAPDPASAREARRAARQQRTLADAWAELEANPVRRRDGAPLRPRTLEGYRLAWRRLAPVLGSRPIKAITAEAVEHLRGRLLREAGAAATAQALALLSVLMGGMPRDARGRPVQKPRVEPRRRFLDADELSALLRGLEAESPLWRVFWLCCLLAPLRRGNIARARWSDLRLEPPARWLVPAEQAKGGKLLALPIAEPLADILRRWRAIIPHESWVFPARLTAGPSCSHDAPITQVAHSWRRVLRWAEMVRLCDAIAAATGGDGRERFRAALADIERRRHEALARRGRAADDARQRPAEQVLEQLRAEARALGIDPEPLAIRDACPHDLRRTAASWAVQSGASLAVVAASLGHRSTQVTEAHYAHLADEPVRRMLNDNATRVLGVAGIEPERVPAVER